MNRDIIKLIYFGLSSFDSRFRPVLMKKFKHISFSYNPALLGYKVNILFLIEKPYIPKFVVQQWVPPIKNGVKAIRDAGIDIFAVGVGRARVRELEQITGKKDRVWKTRSRSFTDIGQFNQKLIKEICEVTEATCTDQEVDLIFMLDSSGSIGSDNFEIAKKWLISITKSFEIGKRAAQVSVMQFTDQAVVRKLRIREMRIRKNQRIRIRIGIRKILTRVSRIRAAYPGFTEIFFFEILNMFL